MKEYTDALLVVYVEKYNPVQSTVARLTLDRDLNSGALALPYANDSHSSTRPFLVSEYLEQKRLRKKEREQKRAKLQQDALTQAHASAARGGGAALDNTPPPSSNTGGNSQTWRTKEPLPPKGNSVSIDTLSIVGALADVCLRFDDSGDYENPDISSVDKFAILSRDLSKALGINFLAGAKQGRNGYHNSMSLVYTDKRQQGQLGFIAWGGNNDTYQLYFTGELCAYINSLGLMSDFHKIAVAYNMRITRADLAYDDFEGAIAITEVQDLWRLGRFTFTRSPSYDQAGKEWHSPELKTGRTCYIGEQKNGKSCCIYEKGKQLGDKFSKWVRWELRFSKKDRIIPLDVLSNPAPYFKGAYPLFETFVSAVPSEIIKTIKVKAKIAVAKAVETIKTHYGKYFSVLRELLGDSSLLDSVSSDGVPSRLVFPMPYKSVAPFELLDLPFVSGRGGVLYA